MTPGLPDFDTIRDDLAFLDDWDERYAYIIDLGRRLDPLPAALHDDAHKARGCASQVWLDVDEAADGRLLVRGDSDASIVKGLVALMVALFSGRTRPEIGVVPQDLAVYPDLSARENLTVFAKLHGVAGGEIAHRVSTVLEWIGLADRGDDGGRDHRPDAGYGH